MRRALQTFAVAATVGVASLAGAMPALAGSAWDEIRAGVFAGRAINPAGDAVLLTAPIRPLDQRAVPIEVAVHFADGRTVRALTLIVDENPSPVAARFDIGGQRDAVRLSTLLRLNAATQVRAIVEASDGQLYAADRFVKFAGGQAACAAPPSGTPQEIAATMGRMSLDPLGKRAALTEMTPRAHLKIMHPNHTGMVLDQLTLLYVPLRIVTDVEVRQGEERVFAMQGSISLAQNPVVDFDYRVNGAETLHIEARDSQGASWAHDFPVGQGS